VLRQDREQFFPGSQQKKHIIGQLFNQLKLELSAFTSGDWQKFIRQINRHQQEKNIQAFALNAEAQTVLKNLGLTGELALRMEHDEYLYLVEANVGINKANRLVSRQAILEYQAYAVRLTLNLQNNNLPLGSSALRGLLKPDNPNFEAAQHNGYVNYQRLLYLPSWQVESVVVNDQKLSYQQLPDLEAEDGQVIKQVAFLVVAPEQENTRIEIIFRQTASSGRNQRTLMLQKQPGVPPYPFTIITPKGQQHDLELRQDMLVLVD
jgi:hypothetical protein